MNKEVVVEYRGVKGEREKNKKKKSVESRLWELVIIFFAFVKGSFLAAPFSSLRPVFKCSKLVDECYISVAVCTWPRYDVVSSVLIDKTSSTVVVGLGSVLAEASDVDNEGYDDMPDLEWEIWKGRRRRNRNRKPMRKKKNEMC